MERERVAREAAERRAAEEEVKRKAKEAEEEALAKEKVRRGQSKSQSQALMATPSNIGRGGVGPPPDLIRATLIWGLYRLNNAPKAGFLNASLLKGEAPLLILGFQAIQGDTILQQHKWHHN